MSMIGYCQPSDLTQYAAERGFVLNIDAAFLLRRALDWLESKQFVGEKTDPLQALSFPRNGDTEVPEKIVRAQLQAAIEYNNGNDLLEPLGQRVLSEQAGPVSVTYSDKGNQSMRFPYLDSLLQEWVVSRGTFNIPLERA